MNQRDQTPIFGALAPLYWQAGLPVIPLHYREKKPIPLGWSQFSEKMPPVELQEHWLTNHANCNIGLVLGAQSQMVMIDIDTVDPNIITAIQQVLPPSPWERIGAKGKVLAYRYSGERSFQIKSAEGKILVELLSDRRQVVLPPSIHPDTKAPYTSNCDLLSVHNALPGLPDGIELILRGALEEAGVKLSLSGSTRVTDFVSAGARDNQMTSLAGLLAWGITRGEKTFKEAEGQLRAWASMLTEKVAGDDVDIEKGVRNLATFLVRDVLEKRRPLQRVG